MKTTTTTKVLFDMDGTIADLYNVKDWLQKLESSDTSVFSDAKPLVKIKSFKSYLKNLKEQGFKVEVTTWLPKNATKEYEQAVANAKKEWLQKYGILELLDNVNYLSYGIDKSQTENDFIFDDDDKVLNTFKGKGFHPRVLQAILKTY